MKKVLVSLILLGLVGCTPDREIVQVFKGEDGSSCSVSDYTLGEEVLGARINCTDGSSAIVLNGSNGADGIDGADGLDGRDGEDGRDGKSCRVYRLPYRNYATVVCGHHVARIYDGEDGQDGVDGEDGENGQDGTDGQDGADGQDSSGGTSLSSISMSSSCIVVDGSNSAKLNGGSGEVKLYSTTNCSGSSTSLHDGEVSITDNGNLLFNVSGSNNLQLLTFN